MDGRFASQQPILLQIRDAGGLPDHAFTEATFGTKLVENQLDANVEYAYLLGRALPDDALQATSSELRPASVGCPDMWRSATLLPVPSAIPFTFHCLVRVSRAFLSAHCAFMGTLMSYSVSTLDGH